MYDALLLLHVLAAFALAAAIVLFTALVVAGRRVDTPPEAVALFRISRLGEVLVIAGSVGTLVLGLWLAIYLDAYHPWDGWIVAAIVLWLATGFTGDRAGREFNRARDRARELAAAGETGPSAELAGLLRAPRGLSFHLATTTGLVVILLLMIFKPGA